jgi:hypothetical protein
MQAPDAELPAGADEPDGHIKQVPPSVAPTTGEYEPIPQLLQLPGPDASLYFPATHAVHVPPLLPV